MWSNPQVCQRDGENLFGCPAWRHGAHDPTLVTGVEHALDREGTIDAGLHSASAKDSHDLLRRKCWNWQVVLHLLDLPGYLGGIVEHLHTSSRFAVAACQHARTHSRSVTESTTSGT